MSKEKQIEERNELVELLEDIGHDWDAYIDECQENEERPQLSYEDFYADSILEAGYRKQSVGEWIAKDNINGRCSIAVCSNCGTTKGLAVLLPIETVIRDFPYCEKCGAKMKGEEK